MYATHSLSNAEISRYSRQLLIPEICVEGQCRLRKTSALIVGAGGLGCPVAQYLAAAGFAKLGIVDYDTIELDNLHRQVLHSEDAVGTSKAASIAVAVKRLNSSVTCIEHSVQLNAANALSIMRDYDVILDCSDNVPTRYLVNDAAVLLNKPLISGSALKWEGQCTVYHYGKTGPCYRCLFPRPPPPETVTNCSEGGVLGPIVGVIGSLQALEAIKIVVGLEPNYSQRMYLFDGLTGVPRVIKLRARRSDCELCGETPLITTLLDSYESFCGSGACDKVIHVRKLDTNERVTTSDYDKMMKTGEQHTLIDVRPAHEFAIASLPGSISAHISDIPMDQLEAVTPNQLNLQESGKVIVVCHQGNDSQEAVLQLRKRLQSTEVKDIIGGLQAWTDTVDSAFPKY